MTPRRSEAFWLALALVVRSRAVRARRGRRPTQADLIGLFAVPPFIAAVGTGRRADRGRGGAGGRAVPLVAGAVDDFFGSFEHLLKVGAGRARRAAWRSTSPTIRRARRAQLPPGQRGRPRARGDRRLDNAGSRILTGRRRRPSNGTPPPCGRWTAPRGTLRCTVDLAVPATGGSRASRSSARDFEFGTGIGLPGPRAGQRRAGMDRGHHGRTTTLPEAPAAAAIGVRSAAAFPIMGERRHPRGREPLLAPAPARRPGAA